MNLYLHVFKHFKTFSLCPNILTPESSKTITLINGLLFYFKFQKQKFMHLWLYIRLLWSVPEPVKRKTNSVN
jgi:hypothetical protein